MAPACPTGPRLPASASRAAIAGRSVVAQHSVPERPVVRRVDPPPAANGQPAGGDRLGSLAAVGSQYVPRRRSNRRHLEVGERAAVGVKIKQTLEAAALDRKRTGGVEGGKIAGRGRKKRDSANLREPYDAGKASEKAAEIVGVSARSNRSAGAS